MRTTNPFGLMATPSCLLAQGKPRVRFNRKPAADTVTCQAVAVFVANAAYKAARESTQPAKSLDNMADALPELLPKILGIVHARPDDTDTLHGYITARLWAYTAIEHSRIEAGDGYGYIFDLLADHLSKGADPHIIRTDALAAPRRLRDLAEAGA